MLVPSNKLIFIFAVLVVPCTLFLGIAPAAAPFLLPILAAALLMFLVDAATASQRLRGVTIELPEVVRLAKLREGTVDVTIVREQPNLKALLLGLPFPAELGADCDILPVRITDSSARHRINFRCTPQQRGNYRLERAYLEAASPLGFWAVRQPRPCASEIRVYPNLRQETGGAAAVFLRRGMFGLQTQRQVGRGREFERLREYAPGDNYDEIYWKATARRGRPVTKVFQIEKTQEVYVVIDSSRLSARRQNGNGSNGESEAVLERFINAALTIGLAAEKQGDLFGILTFSDQVTNFVRARNGKAHYGVCRDVLYTLSPDMVTPDFTELFSFIRTRLRRRALLIFLTSLDDPVLADAFQKDVALIGPQHLILVNMIHPPEARPLFADDSVGTIDEIYQNLGGHVRWHGLRELGRALHRHGVQFALLENEKLCAETVTQYMNIKQRQLL